MLIDFNQELIGYDGKVLVGITQRGKEEEPLTLAYVCCQSLLSNHQDDKGDLSEKMRRFTLAQRIQGSVKHVKGGINLTAEEVAKIKELAGKSYPTAVVGPIILALDPAEGAKAGPTLLQEEKAKEEKPAMVP